MLVTNLLLLVIAAGFGYLTVQWRPDWFSDLSGRLLSVGWIVALLLAAALRAASVVYGANAVFALLSLGGGYVLGIWLARRMSSRSEK